MGAENLRSKSLMIVCILRYIFLGAHTLLSLCALFHDPFIHALFGVFANFDFGGGSNFRYDSPTSNNSNRAQKNCTHAHQHASTA